jgi:hypothetical protein
LKQPSADAGAGIGAKITDLKDKSALRALATFDVLA